MMREGAHHNDLIGFSLSIGFCISTNIVRVRPIYLIINNL